MTNRLSYVDEVLKKLATRPDGGYRPDGTWLTVAQVGWLRRAAQQCKRWHNGSTSGHGAGTDGSFETDTEVIHVFVIVSPQNGAGFMNITRIDKAERAAKQAREALNEEYRRVMLGERAEWMIDYPDFYIDSIQNSPFATFQNWKRDFKGC